jgi:predicted nucleic acid-binding protein
MLFTKNEIYKIIARTVEKQDIFECSEFFELIHDIISRSVFIDKPPKLEKLSSDKGDQPFIELADAVHANYLVTNDYQNGLLDLKTYNNLNILTSSSFIKDYDRMIRNKKVKE